MMFTIWAFFHMHNAFFSLPFKQREVDWERHAFQNKIVHKIKQHSTNPYLNSHLHTHMKCMTQILLILFLSIAHWRVSEWERENNKRIGYEIALWCGVGDGNGMAALHIILLYYCCVFFAFFSRFLGSFFLLAFSQRIHFNNFLKKNLRFFINF